MNGHNNVIIHPYVAQQGEVLPLGLYRNHKGLSRNSPKICAKSWDKDALEQDITNLIKHIFLTRSINNSIIPNSMTKPFAIEF